MKKTPVTVRFVEKRLLEILGLLILAVPLVYFLFLYHQGQALLSPALALQSKDCPGCQRVQMSPGESVLQRVHPHASGVLLLVQGFKQPVSQMTKYLNYAQKHQLSILLLDLNESSPETPLPRGWGWGCLERERVTSFLTWSQAQFSASPLVVVGTGLAHHSLKHQSWSDAFRLLVLDEPVPGLKKMIRNQVTQQQMPAFVGSHFYRMLEELSDPGFQDCRSDGPPAKLPLWVFHTPEPLVEAEARQWVKIWSGGSIETYPLKDAKFTPKAEHALTLFIQKALK